MSKLEISRRKFLGTGSLALALPLASIPAAAEIGNVPQPFSGGVSRPAVIPYRKLPVRQRGATVIAVDPPTDGVSDCTQAIQNAIDELPEDGGTVLVRYHQTGGLKECIYMIDASNLNPAGPKNDPRYYGIMLRSNMLLQFEPGVQLMEVPNNKRRAYVLYCHAVHDVEIANATIIGERYNHTSSGTGTDEWGYGIAIAGVTGVTVRSSHVSDLEGDGVSILAASAAPSDVVLWDVVSTGNRRQGVSITSGNGIYLLDSEFSNTHGTAPADGVDIEGSVSNVTIDNCVLANNQGNGVELNAGGSGVTINNINVTNSVLSGNYSGVYVGGRSTSTMDSATIYGNAIYQNRSFGIHMGGPTKNYTIGGSKSCDPRNNSFANNQVTASHQVLYPISAKAQKQGYVDGSAMTLSASELEPANNNVVGWNYYYSPTDPSPSEARPCTGIEPPALGDNPTLKQ